MHYWYTVGVKYNLQRVQDMYEIAPSTMRYWRVRLGGLGEHRHDGLYYAEVVALGVVEHLVRQRDFSIRKLDAAYLDIVRLAMDENLPQLRQSWLLVSRNTQRLMLVDRNEDLGSHRLEWQPVDMPKFLAQLDAQLRSSDGLAERLRELAKTQKSRAQSGHHDTYVNAY